MSRTELWKPKPCGIYSVSDPKLNDAEATYICIIEPVKSWEHIDG